MYAMPTTNVIRVESVRFEGYMEKQRKRKTWAWRKYWFVVEDGQLAYYENETKVEGSGLIDLGQAIAIKPQVNGARNHTFYITMKISRIHIFCTQSEALKEHWIQMLQQARLERLLQPQRSSSMMRPRCNSIPDPCGPEEILSFERPETPTSPPSTPGSGSSSSSQSAWSSPPNTPTSPLKLGSPKFQKATTQSALTNSPKFTKSSPKGLNSPKFKKEFLDQPAWVTRKEDPPPSSAGNIELNGRKCRSENAPEARSECSPSDMSEQTYAVQKNSVVHIPAAKATYIPVERKLGNLKSPVVAKKTVKLPVTRVFTGPIISPQNDPKSNNNSRFPEQDTKSPGITRQTITRVKSQHSLVSRTYTSGSRPFSGPGSLSRAHPVSGERPTIEPRASAYKPSSSSSLSASSESESENPVSSRPTLKRLCSNESNASLKSIDIPSKSSTGAVVLRRKLATTRSMPFFNKRMDSSSDSESECDSPSQKTSATTSTASSCNSNCSTGSTVFSPRASEGISSLPVLRYTLRVRDDEYYETLWRVLREPRPSIPKLRYPRLELTFRSAFDDIRLFLANNRGCDEIFPVPRLSERGGKAIKKLQRILEMLS